MARRPASRPSCQHRDADECVPDAQEHGRHSRPQRHGQQAPSSRQSQGVRARALLRLIPGRGGGRRGIISHGGERDAIGAGRHVGGPGSPRAHGRPPARRARPRPPGRLSLLLLRRGGLVDDEDDDRSARAPEPDDVIRICRALNEAGRSLPADRRLRGHRPRRRPLHEAHRPPRRRRVGQHRPRQARPVRARGQRRRRGGGGRRSAPVVVRVADEVVVDLMGRACGLSYAEASSDAETLEREGVRIPVASPSTLIRTKETPRPCRTAIDRAFLEGVLRGASSRLSPVDGVDAGDARLRRRRRRRVAKGRRRRAWKNGQGGAAVHGPPPGRSPHHSRGDGYPPSRRWIDVTIIRTATTASKWRCGTRRLAHQPAAMPTGTAAA